MASPFYVTRETHLIKLMQMVCDRQNYATKDLLYVSHLREITVAPVCNDTVYIDIGPIPARRKTFSQMRTDSVFLLIVGDN